MNMEKMGVRLFTIRKASRRETSAIHLPDV